MLIVSDLEGTLTGGETWRGMLAFLRAHGRTWEVWRFLMPRSIGQMAARAGLLNLNQYRTRFIADMPRLAAGSARSQWDTIAEWIVEHVLWPKRYTRLLTELSTARKAGARVVICSGTYQPVLDAFTRRLGFEGLGSPLEWKGDHATGRLAGPVNQGPAKAERLRAAGLTGIQHAYGDTAGDIPMLSLAHQATVIDHDPSLTRFARAKGWLVRAESDVC
jgi:phosphoserine phosphatase